MTTSKRSEAQKQMDDKRIKQVIEKSVDKEIISGGHHTTPPPHRFKDGRTCRGNYTVASLQKLKNS